MNKKQYPSNKNTILFIQVFQMGIIQVEKNFSINSFFNKKVRIGCSRFCDLYLPFERHASDIDIFKVGKGKVEIFLDPRLDGYINTSQRFGEVHEFTSPRDALGVLTSIDDPLAVDLKLGARGRIRFFGFEIVFKVEPPAKKKIFKNLPKIEKNFLQLPPYDAPVEKYVIPISIIATACLFIPIINWLLNFPSKEITGLLSVPSEVTAEFIAPENMRLLPYVFGTSYIADSTPQLALLWIHELQMRWENAEKGKEYNSIIPFLANSKAVVAVNDDIAVFQAEIITQYSKTETERKQLSEKERYYSYIKKSPMFSSILSGDEGKSNYFTIEKRIQQLSVVDKALLEYLKLDHKIIKEEYKNNYGAKKLGIVLPPQTGQVLGRQPDPIFNKEYDDYKNAEFFAEVSENSDFRKFQMKFLKQETDNEKNKEFIYSEPVFISSQGLVYPYQFIDQKNNMNADEDYNTFLFNSQFSDAFILPPLPKPKAIIDLKMVEFVVYNKKEEVRSCYNSALRKNSHLNGEIKLSWMINELGKAQNIKVLNSSIQDTNLFRCIESRIKTWKFPKSKNGLFTVHFPFKFVYVEKE